MQINQQGITSQRNTQKKINVLIFYLFMTFAFLQDYFIKGNKEASKVNLICPKMYCYLFGEAYLSLLLIIGTLIVI